MKIKADQLPFDIPIVIEEATFSQVIDFRAVEQKLFAVKDDEELEEDERQRREEAYLIEAVSKVCSGPLHRLDFTLPGDDVNRLFGQDYRIKPGDEISLMRLYVHFVNLINGYNPDKVPSTYRLKWKGDSYYIQARRAQKLLSEDMPAKFTVGEVIEVNEFSRLRGKQIEQKGDPQGNLAFTLGLNHIAILMRKKGEELPIDPQERKAFINNRSHLFSDLPYKNVIDIRFFLISILEAYTKTLIMSSSSKVKSPTSAVRPSRSALSWKPTGAPKMKRVVTGT